MSAIVIFGQKCLRKNEKIVTGACQKKKTVGLPCRPRHFVFFYLQMLSGTWRARKSRHKDELFSRKVDKFVEKEKKMTNSRLSDGQII